MFGSSVRPNNLHNVNGFKGLQLLSQQRPNHIFAKPTAIHHFCDETIRSLFLRQLQAKGVVVDHFEVDILQKMKYLCAVTLSTIKKKINSNRRKHCFELFGFDFFIDNDYNVFLIEVNTNPCLEESSQLLAKLLPRLLDDLFKLTID